MVVRRYDKRGNPYYFNKRRGKRTSRRAWRISQAWRKKKKRIPPLPDRPVWTRHFNQAVNTILQNHLLKLKFKIYVSWGQEKIRVFQKDAFKLKDMIDDIIDDYMQLAKTIRPKVASPYVIFSLKEWVRYGEMELALDYTDFVGIDPIAIPVYQIFKKYF